MTATVPCEVCTGESHAPLFVKQGYEFVRCQGCGHIFVRVDVSGPELFRMYDKGFFSDGAYADYVRDKDVLQKNFSRFVGILRRYSAGGCLLEIGCAYGFFLELARRHWKVTGVDINGGATSFACERLGLDVLCGDLLDLEFEEEGYDAVVLWDTIEHLLNPGKYVEKIARILRHGGVLALTTGDMGSLVARARGERWRPYYPPSHLHYFSRRTITLLLERFGLRVVRIRAMGFYRSMEMMLHRMFLDRRSWPFWLVNQAAKGSGLSRLVVYLNLFDVMLLIAKKP